MGFLKKLVLDLNSFFASVEQQINPDIRNKPVIVVPSKTDATSAIAASYEAKKYGIKTNTKVWEAKKICPDLVCVQADHRRYVEFHHRIKKAIDKEIPIEKSLSIDEFSCVLQGDQRTRKGAFDLSCKIKKRIFDDVGEFVKCSIGISANNTLAKIASAIQKPDGLYIIDEENLYKTLISLKTRAIPGVGRNMEKRLCYSGVQNMADLLNLKPKHMRKIWHSVAGENLYYTLRGLTIPDKETTKRVIGHSHVLAPKFRPQEKAKIVAQRLTLKAASRMREYDYHAQAMYLSIRLTDGRKLSADKHFRHSGDNFTLLQILQDLWEQIFRFHNQPLMLKKVAVSLHSLIPIKNIQPEIFDYKAAKVNTNLKKEKASKAMDILNSKYGKDTVVMGFSPSASSNFSGTKIAFNRIPEFSEFSK